MQNTPKNIAFDRQKNPGIEFDIFPQEQILKRKDLDHNPKHLHRVDFYILFLITSGEGKHTIDFKEYNYSPGTVLTIRKDQVHKFHENSAKGFLLIFTEEFVISYLERSSARKISELYNELFFEQLTELSREEMIEYLAIIELIKKEFNQSFDDHTAGIIRNLLQVLMSKIHRKRKVIKQFQKGHRYMEQFLQLQKLVEEMCTTSRSVQFYANELGVSTRTLNNITHNTVNNSCKTFIDEILILQIKRQLINSTLSIKEIAYNSGFDEPSNLFKFFKRYTHQTPEHFRSDHSTT